MILARAPFRIPLGGGSTNLPSYYAQHGGFVLSAAINKYLYINVNRPAADEYIRVKYTHYGPGADAGRGAARMVRPALIELNLGGSLEIVSMADVPQNGAGFLQHLSGGPADHALYELKRERVPTQALAEMACHIE